MLLFTHQTPVFQSSDNAIHWINFYLVDNAIRFSITYPLESDLSIEYHYPPFTQLGPGFKTFASVIV